MVGQTTFRFSAWIALLALTPILCFSQTAPFDLPAQPLAESLKALGAQANVNVLVPPALVDGKQAPSLKATLTVSEALSRLLKDTGLEFHFVNEQTVVIRLKTTTSMGGPGASTLALAQAEDTEGSSGANTLRSGSPPDGAAQAGTTGEPNPHVPLSAPADQAKPGFSKTTGQGTRADTRSPTVQLDEVVVTAQKREESLLSVPVPVTALSADALVDASLYRLQDYYAQVPGLNLTIGNSGQPSLAIRGITTSNGANPTVGIVVDDIPFGSSTALGNGFLVPDIDPSDLARVEVLRGPQGTLYGADSIGGLIKYVTVDPSMDGVSARIEAGANQVQNASRLGYVLRGAANLPLSDTVALRVSGFYHDDAGYIDNIQTGERGANRGAAAGGHLSLLWKPSDDWSLKLGALIQDSHRYGSLDIFPSLGIWNQDVLRGTGGASNTMQAYSATWKAKLGSTELTVASGFNTNTLKVPLDLTSSIGPVLPLLGFPNASSASVVSDSKTEKFSQEIRWSVPLGKRFDALFGLFYTHETNPNANAGIFAVDPATGSAVGTILLETSSLTYVDYAGFTDLTVHFTDRFDVQFGGRESQNTQHYSASNAGPYVVDLLGYSSPLLQPEETIKDNSFTYLVTPRYRLSPDLMLYARFASGYRAGGPNTFSALYQVPPQFAPDKTRNYEIGAKGTAFNRMLSFDASVYYIDWQNIQLSLVGPPPAEESYFANGSRAKSEGVEISAEITPWNGFTIGGWVAWNEAILTEAFPASSAAYGSPGDRLPYSARITGNLSLQQAFSIARGVSGFVNATESYVGNRYGEFASIFTYPPSPARQVYSPYAQTDLRFGAIVDGGWTINLYGNNLTDRHGQLAGGLGFFPVNAFTYIQPRTIGVSVIKSF